nr:uncharacterized protein LOC112779413 [Arachis hypogaea]
MTTIAKALTRLTLPPQTTQSTQHASTSSSLPSQPQPNPKGSINAITLRSGTKLDKNVAIPAKLSEETNNEEVEDEVEVMRSEGENVDKHEENPPKVKEPKRKTLLEEPLPISFPTLAKKAKKTKFMGCMYDLGVCVSIMPLPIYERLNLAPLKRSGVRFVLANKSIMSVIGIAENVIVNIQGLLFPADFHTLETPSIDSTKPSSILLGRPFLKTAHFKLDAHSGVYSFESDGKLVKFTLEESDKPIRGAYIVFGCDIV